ncbi:MAG: hypothetical protein WBL44_06605 [Nitrososphaeraceae archaeon]
MYEGRLVPKSVLKEVRKGLMQGGQQEVTYELDNEKILNVMLEFSGLDNSR